MKLPKASSGFTLVEILIVLAIIALLAAIAIPNYAQFVLRGHRTEARNLLLEIAARQERFIYGRANYAPDLVSLGYPPGPVFGPARRYAVTMDSTNTTYTLTATPQGPQVEDACGFLRIDNLQVKTASVALPECWSK